MGLTPVNCKHSSSMLGKSSLALSPHYSLSAGRLGAHVGGPLQESRIVQGEPGVLEGSPTLPMSETWGFSHSSRFKILSVGSTHSGPHSRVWVHQPLQCLLNPLPL